ncbi:hypothetical protein AB5I41_18890 [Sphingomonas sp. MMS24-JH45]
MRLSELDYLREREAAEWLAATRSEGPSRQAHQMLAQRYADRIRIIERRDGA